MCSTMSGETMALTESLGHQEWLLSFFLEMTNPEFDLSRREDFLTLLCASSHCVLCLVWALRCSTSLSVSAVIHGRLGVGCVQFIAKTLSGSVRLV